MSGETEATITGEESEQPLRSIGRYAIERKLGQGGMGTVYLARHMDLKRVVALKVLPSDKAKNPTLVRRFKAEAQAAAHLEHPNIVSVYDTGESDGHLYITMEFVDGIDLFEYLKRRKTVAVKRSIELIKQVAAALQHAFEQNIVHRDIKPSNLMLRRDGTVKLTDLGLARSIDETLETNITRAGTTVGTVDYMAPEQARNSKAADTRSDIYSLGCTWYQMLTGEPPYPDGSMMNKLAAHSTKPLPDPRLLNENIPEGLYAILQRMTAKKPDDRYQTPQELLEDINRSKLLRTQFSNQILHDLDDDEEPTDRTIAEDHDSDDDAEDVDRRPRSRTDHRDEDDEDLRRSGSIRRRTRTRADDDDETIADAKRRRARSSHGDDDDDRIAEGRRRRSHSSHNDDDDDEVVPDVKPKRSRSSHDEDDEEPIAEPRRRRAKSSHDDDHDGDSAPAAKRRRSHSSDDEDDDEPSDPRQPIKSRLKKPSRTHADDDELDEPHPKSGRNLPSPSQPGSKSNPGLSREQKSPSSRDGRLSSSLSYGDQKAGRSGTRIMPPKMLPSIPDMNPPARFSIETLKNYGFVLGVGIILVVVGWAFINSGGQFNQRNGPSTNQVQVQSNTTPAPETQQHTDTHAATNDTSANATNPADRPSAEFDIVKLPLPPWTASEFPLPKDLPTFTVGPGQTSTTHFNDINEALRAAEKKGGILRLQGPEPFFLASTELRDAKQICIMAHRPEDRPLIIIKPSESGLPTGLTLVNSQLDLRGVHFVFKQPANASALTNSMVTVSDGQLFVRDCSFTALGNSKGTTYALNFSSQRDAQSPTALDPQVLLDRVTIRGDNVTGLRLNRTTANIVIQNSLFATGIAPAIHVAGQFAQNVADANPDRPRRIIRVFRSTLCARKEALNFSAENTTQPPLTAILFRDSVCSAEGSGNDAVLVSVTQWPVDKSNPNGWMTNLQWTSLSSIYLGFDQLVDYDKFDKSSYKVTSAEYWQRVWARRPEPNQFQPIFWQESAFADLSSVVPSDFDNAKLPYRDVKTTDGNPPGCVTSRLHVPEVISQTRLMATSQRPKLPAIPGADYASETVKKIDLAKEDLGQVLRGSDWQSGTVFEVTGFGLKQSSPIRIHDKSVRIVFRPIEGSTPLRIQPKATDSKTKADGLGFISIENGTLDLQYLVLEAAGQSKGGGTAPWLITAKNSTVILRGCQLSSNQQQDVDQHLGLVQWTIDSSEAPSGTELPFLSVNDSVLLTTGIGIRAEIPHGNVFIKNSILAARGAAISILPNRFDDNVPPAVDLAHVTISASGAAIRVEATSEVPREGSPSLRIFSDNSAIVSPLAFKDDEAKDACVMDFIGPHFDQKQVEWWGNSNGFSSDVPILLRRPNAGPITTAAAWQAAWGNSSDVRLLTGPKGVSLTKPLPTKWTLFKSPAAFTLDPDSQSATWSNGSSPIGANLQTLNDAITSKPVPKSQSGPKKPAPSKTNQSTSGGGF